MDMNELDSEFQAVETELNLSQTAIKGVYFWDYLRPRLYKEIIMVGNEMNRDIDSSQNVTGQNLLGKLYAFIRNIFVKNPFFASSAKLMIVSDGMRQIRNDGYWENRTFDPVLMEIEGSYEFLEMPIASKHFSPSVTEGLRYLDLIYYSDGVRQRLQFTPFLSNSDKEIIQQIQQEFQSRFDFERDLQEEIERIILLHSTQKRLYELLLDRIDPDIGLIRSGREPFIDACDSKNVPVVQLQYSVLSDISYDVKKGLDLNYFPDYLLTWGEFWEEGITFPIDNVITVGNPYLEREKQRFSDVKSKNQIVFVSQWSIGEDLSKFAVKLSKLDPDFEIVYKIHPRKYSTWKESYPWLADSSIRVVDTDKVSLPELFSNSSIQVGVYSSALVEGLYFDLDTFIVDLPRFGFIERLLEQGYATKVSSPEELLSQIHEGVTGKTENPHYFFEEEPIQNIQEVFDSI